MQKEKVALGGSILSAIAASLCCIGPLIALLLGATGFAAASVFAKWRPVLLVLTFALLGLAWFLTYRKPATECREGAACPTKPVPRWNKVVLWVATIFAIGMAAFPLYSGAIARLLEAKSTPTTSDSSQLATLSVRVPTMDCPSCAATIERTVLKQPGVAKADISFDTKQGVIHYDPQKTSDKQLIAAIDKTGFKAQPINTSPNP